MIERKINTSLLNSYSDDINNFLKPIYASRGVLEHNLDLSLAKLLTPNFKQLNKALDILASAIIKQQKVTIVADFDADGATSCAVAIKALKIFGLANVDFMVPNRFTDGYGLNTNIVNKAYANQTAIIITVDNGISSFAGCALARKLGIKVIITDHHLPAERLPLANAIINPNLKDCVFPSKHLAGVGVVFYLMSALKTHLTTLDYFKQHNIDESNIKMKNLLDLVALGTIADVAKLDTNNQILVKAGLQVINSGNCCYGIKALIKISNKTHQEIKSSDLGFIIAPKINASGRMDDISRGIKCLLSIDYNDAYKYALELNEYNVRRKNAQNQATDDVKSYLKNINITNKFSICLYNKDWHEGVVGIVAGICREKYGIPSFIFAKSNDYLKGSARSIPQIHIKDLLTTIDNKYPKIIDKFGGHAMAAGLVIQEKNWQNFSDILEQEIADYFNGKIPSNDFVVDGSLNESDVNLANALLLANHIWGNGFEEPIFYNDFAIKEQKIIGDKHLKLRVKLVDKVFDAIAFFQNKITTDKITMAYNLSVNTYQKNKALQLIVRKIIEL